MRRHQDEFDDEIRGHLALDIQERMERGENADDARFAAMRELGNLTLTRESMQAIWRPPWAQPAEALLHDVRLAVRSLGRARGLAATVVATLALGIGANAAVFSVVRHVLLRTPVGWTCLGLGIALNVAGRAWANRAVAA